MRDDIPNPERLSLRPDAGANRRFFRAAGIPNLLERMKTSDRVVGITDQGIQASINFLAVLVFARWLTQDDFGTFAVAAATSVLLSDLHHAMIVLPFIVSCPTVEKVKEQGANWYWLHFAMTGAVVGVLIVFLSILLVIDAAAWLRDVAKFTILLAPLSLNFQFARRWFYQSMKLSLILRMSVAHFVIYAAGIAVVIFAVPTTWMAVLAFAIGLASGVAVALVGDRPPAYRMAKGMFAAWLHTRSFAVWSSLGRMVGQIDYQVMSLIIAAVAGPAAVAAFVATRILIRPVGVLIAGVDMIDKPRASRALDKDGLSGLKSSIQHTGRFLLIFGLPYLVLLFIFADVAISFFFGTKYTEFGDELRLWAVIALIYLLEQPLMSQLVIARRTRTIFMCNSFSAIITVGLVAALIGDYGITGAIVAVLAGRLVSVALLFSAGRSLYRAQHAKCRG